MDAAAYKQLDGLGMAELVRQGEATPVEFLEQALIRLETVNPQLNAVTLTLAELARKEAAASTDNAPFAGVPFLLKDLGEMMAGVRLTNGSRALADFVPPIDSTLVQRQRTAGLLTIGKSNTSEFGLLPTTESELLGACRNPWDTSRMAGGSSGGAAAAVAAGIVPVAHASDGGGSIRIPASICGVFGLKPTRGRTPQGPNKGDTMSGLSIGHCVSRSVRDSAALLDVTTGPEPGDPYAAPPRRRPFLQEVSTEPPPLRIAFTTETLDGRAVHPDCAQAVNETAQLLSDLGHQVFRGAPLIEMERFTEAFVTLWAAGCAWAMKGVGQLLGTEPQPEMFEPVTWGLYEMSARQTPADYLLAVQALQQIARVVAIFFQQADLWLTPVITEPPLPLGSFDPIPDNPLRGFQKAIDFVAFTPIANATGQPAMSVPLFWNEEGLPIGSHFMGRFGDEATLFQLAGQLERARPWADRRPGIDSIANPQ